MEQKTIDELNNLNAPTVQLIHELINTRPITTTDWELQMEHGDKLLYAIMTLTINTNNAATGIQGNTPIKNLTTEDLDTLEWEAPNIQLLCKRVASKVIVPKQKARSQKPTMQSLKERIEELEKLLDPTEIISQSVDTVAKLMYEEFDERMPKFDERVKELTKDNTERSVKNKESMEEFKKEFDQFTEKDAPTEEKEDTSGSFPIGYDPSITSILNKQSDEGLTKAELKEILDVIVYHGGHNVIQYLCVYEELFEQGTATEAIEPYIGFIMKPLTNSDIRNRMTQDHDFGQILHHLKPLAKFTILPGTLTLEEIITTSTIAMQLIECSMGKECKGYSRLQNIINVCKSRSIKNETLLDAIQQLTPSHAMPTESNQNLTPWVKYNENYAEVGGKFKDWRSLLVKRTTSAVYIDLMTRQDPLYSHHVANLFPAESLNDRHSNERHSNERHSNERSSVKRHRRSVSSTSRSKVSNGSSGSHLDRSNRR